MTSGGRGFDHGAKLIDPEWAKIFPDSLLLEKNRSRRIELNDQRRGPEQRREQQQAKSPYDNIEYALHPLVEVRLSRLFE
jgi:hypothetical protein